MSLELGQSDADRGDPTRDSRAETTAGADESDTDDAGRTSDADTDGEQEADPDSTRRTPDGDTDGAPEPPAYRPMWREAAGVSAADTDGKDRAPRGESADGSRAGSDSGGKSAGGSADSSDSDTGGTGRPRHGIVRGTVEPDLNDASRPQPSFTPSSPEPAVSTGATEGDLGTPSQPRHESTSAASTAGKPNQGTASQPRHGAASTATSAGLGTAGWSRGLGADVDPPLLRDAAGLRVNWQRVQASFVDDPSAAVSDAAALVEHAAQALVGALRLRQRELRDMWDRGSGEAGAPGEAADGDGAADSTEQMRLMVQRYRGLFNQICGPSQR